MRKPLRIEEVTGSLEEILERTVARYGTRQADWRAFADAEQEGYRRAQHRYIGAGASGKHGDGDFIPPGNFTLSVMYVPPAQGNAPHTHEVEEAFFVLQGHVTVFYEDETGHRVEAVLGPWDAVSCPPGVIHGYENRNLEPCYLQVMLGKPRPDLMGYVDDDLKQARDRHLQDSDDRV